MASGRPIKTGFDAFRIYTSYNEKEVYLKNKCNIGGYAIYISILGKIYGDKGYYCQWDDKTQILFCENNIKLNDLKEVVECCFETGLFDKNVFNKYSVLTSREVQKRYLEISHAYKRKRISINTEIKLLSQDDELSLWRRPEKYVNLYLMRVGESDIYKIGYSSKSPTKILYGIKYYVPNIQLVDFIKCEFKYESYFHNLFKDKKVDNVFGFTEYFKLQEEDVKYILDFFKEKRNKSTLYKYENKTLDA